MDSPPSRSGTIASLSRFAAATDTLWSRIAAARPAGTRRAILFVGTQHGSGTSTAACTAAIGLVRNLSARVLLIEVGHGSSTLAKLLGLPEGPGLHELLCSGATPQACLRGSELEGLSILTAGHGSLPPGVLASAGAKRILEQLGAGQDYVIFDASPLQEHPDLQPILLHAQEAVLVLEADRTQREQARSLMQLLQRAGIRILGSVLNRAQPPGFLS